MQKTVTMTDEPLHWPWLPSDIAPAGEETRAHKKPFWGRVPLWIALLWLVGVITFISLGVAANAQLYRHQLGTQASWIAQASQQEARCLQAATTDAARTACATTLANAVTAQQARFDHNGVGFGGRNAATQMHSAFDALYAAACVDPATSSADSQCLSATAPTLRTWAEQEARNAENS